MREWDVISPLDGRYREQLAALREQAGPAAFARARVRAEVCWLLTLAELKLPGFRPLSAKEKALLEKLPALTDADLPLLRWGFPSGCSSWTGMSLRKIMTT